MNFSNCRGIIIKNNKLVVMERKKNGRHYYTFPGGHVERNETCEECIVRELMEEFGIGVKPVRLIYGYEYKNSLQAFYVLEWLSGEIHPTNAEEYQPGQNNGEYNPTVIDLNELNDKNLLPEEIKRQLLADIKTYGKTLNRKFLFLK